MKENSTICAVATGQGGAIGIVRVSGPNAVLFTDRIFRSPREGFSLMEARPNTIHFGHIIDDGNVILDEVLVSVFQAPHSYTGENATEISCHNSPYILQRIMELLVDEGCQLAAPGEYTQRAFLNGKMDLSQAEAVADLIASQTASSHRLAIKQLKNGFSKEFVFLREKLLKITALMELELDFSDHEELEFADRKTLMELLHEIQHKISRLASSFQYGNAIKRGIPIAIVGETNVGKSTLLNTLIGEDKAIVSNIHGTTRDVIEDVYNIDGCLFRFFDTAGIRHTDDDVEQLGINRTYQKIEESSFILWLVDAGEVLARKEIPLLERLQGYENILLVCNKCDLLDEGQENELKSLLDNSSYQHICISAKQQTNIDGLKSILLSLVGHYQHDDNEYTVTNLRQYEQLKKALQCADRVEAGLTNATPTDLVSEDLRECLRHLAEIVGEISSADILHDIFSKFCVGK